MLEKNIYENFFVLMEKKGSLLPENNSVSQMGDIKLKPASWLQMLSKCHIQMFAL